MKEIILLEEGLKIMEEAIVMAKKIMEGYPETKFTPAEYMKFHTCAYAMCIQRPSYAMHLYERYKSALEETITYTVLPALVDKHDVLLLTELVPLWSNYKVMAKWLSRFFGYLDRYFTTRKDLASLNDVCVNCFRVRVCHELHGKFRNAAISLINQERDGMQIDRELLKNVLDFFVDMEEQGKINYYEDFEQVMLSDTADYYSQKASEWILNDSFAEYILKADWCLNQEKGRACHYLFRTGIEKLLEVVKFQLLAQTASKLIEKQQAEGHNMAANYQVAANYQELLSKYASLNLEEEKLCIKESAASTSYYQCIAYPERDLYRSR
ncbi:hypothetical protein HHK36_012457 [Tetracentron sinense]|uniref:Cullin N-terminal domain-containing protein n=1 Tax=Tetracentron sinense TaxID=13715 RepID=A0A834Z8F6_TETSI|nr:hypothetical protein HHK36_012457 [Tetracentron sinense]